MPSAGAVRMDGRDVGAYQHKWLRRHVGLVSQEPVLFGRRLALLLAVDSPLYTVQKDCTLADRGCA